MRLRVLFITKIFCFLFILAIFFIVNIYRTDPDLGWHIKVGESIVATGEAPTQDTFSYTMNGYEWVDHEWLTNAFFFIAYSNNAFVALAIFFALLGAAPFLIWLKRAKSFFTVWIILIGASFINIFMGVRPQFITLALFIALYELLSRLFIAGNKRTLYLFFLYPILFGVWANVHGGFASGLLLFGLWIFIHHATLTFKHSINIKMLAQDVGIFLLSATAPLINPYGIRIYGEIVSVFTSYETSRYIAEWQSGLNLFHPIVIITVALFIMLLIQFRSSINREQGILAGIFFISFMKSIRHGPLFLAAALPVMQQAILVARNEIVKSTDRLGSALVRILSVSGAVLLFSFPIYFMIDTAKASQYEPTTVPQTAVEYLRKQYDYNAFGNVFNGYGWGGYLILNAPEIKVFIDGRMPHWISKDGNSAMRDFVSVVALDKNRPSSRNSWKEIFKKYDIKTVLIESEQVDSTPSESLSDVFVYLFKQYPKLGNFIAYIIGEKKSFSLRDELEKSGWKVFYKDQTATILRCSLCN